MRCLVYIISCYFFFFKQKTAYEMRISDWSSDVCSSDLQPGDAGGRAELEPASLALLSPRAWLGRDDQRGLVVLSRKPSAAKLGHPELRDLARRCRRQAGRQGADGEIGRAHV